MFITRRTLSFTMSISGYDTVIKKEALSSRELFIRYVRIFFHIYCTR